MRKQSRTRKRELCRKSGVSARDTPGVEQHANQREQVYSTRPSLGERKLDAALLAKNGLESSNFALGQPGSELFTMRVAR
jgi:hypothetical protein